MSAFLTNLWTSIFTPGPTPTLVHATNISFLALQVILLSLLLATWSIHFIILSFLCAGLWGGVNWFVRELEEANKREKDKKAEWDRKREGGGGGSEGDDEEDGSGSGTETEDAAASLGVSGNDAERMKVKEENATGQATSVGGLRSDAEADVRKRRSIGEGSSAGELSTDSEWDKVEEAGDMKR